MTILTRNFRKWWQPPRPLRERPEERQVTFLELFYDLVYVVLVAELTHALAAHVDAAHIRNFAFLFFIALWMWLNGASYHELHGNNDIRTRVTTFLQMITVAAMAVFAHDALGETAIGFGLSLAAFQLIMAVMWWRTGVHDPDHRPVSNPYALAYLLSTVALIGSAFAPLNIMVWIWIGAMTLSLAVQFFTFSLGRQNPAVRAQLDRGFQATPSAVERFGLLTIIVLGEVIVGTVRGIADHSELTWTVGGIGLLGMIVAFGLWWLYFDFISHRLPIQTTNWTLVWMYTHLPVTMGIAATGAAVLNVVEHAGESLPHEVRWLLVGAIATTLVGILVLIRTLQARQALPEIYAAGQVAIVISALGVLALGLSPLDTVPLLLALIALLVMPIVFALAFWLRSVDAGDVPGRHDPVPQTADGS